MKKGERRKEELIRIAYTKFLEKGYEQTSVDEIISEAQIAKGTYYHHFQSKDQMLEEVVDMMLQQGAQRAANVLESNLPSPEKIAGIMLAFRPTQDELGIQDTLNRPNNLALHDRMNKKLIDYAVPLLSGVVKEGIAQGIFGCEQIEERLKLILIMSSQMFDDGNFTENDVIAFIDIVEKTLGAKPGTMGVIENLISGGRNDNDQK
ncbi:MAG: TetR/AcrR family transcriptional regulator [Actinomycetaceae bacterium]|nr:TetR/AcrR family transcriptional regulator [Actinomycetaceae bacterium]